MAHDGIAGDDIRETTFTYDAFGSQLTRTLPMGEQELFEYDPVTRRQTRHTSFEGNVTDRVFADFGMLDKILYFAPGTNPDVDPADETVDFAYNALDQKASTTDTRGVTQFAFDAFDRKNQINSPEGILNYEYDDQGRIIRTTIGAPLDPTHDFTNSYDSFGRLETVTTVERNDVVLSTPEVTSYSYDLVGNIQRTDHANGVITFYTYDSLNRLDVLMEIGV